MTSSANDFGGESVTSVLISSDIDGEYLPRPNFVEPALNPLQCYVSRRRATWCGENCCHARCSGWVPVRASVKNV